MGKRTPFDPAEAYYELCRGKFVPDDSLEAINEWIRGRLPPLVYVILP